MPEIVPCPGCGFAGALPAAHPGKAVRCQQCGRAVARAAPARAGRLYPALAALLLLLAVGGGVLVWFLWPGADPASPATTAATSAPKPTTSTTPTTPVAATSGKADTAPEEEPAGNLLVNGSFEEGPTVLKDKVFQSLNAGETTLTGWVVTRGQIDLVSKEHWQPADGERSIDLHGSPGLGGIKQTFATRNGQKYRVSFAMAGHPAVPNGAIKTLAVAAAGRKQDFRFDTSGKTLKQMGWQTMTWEFTAVESQTTLEFYTTTKQFPANGPGLDNVSVIAVK